MYSSLKRVSRNRCKLDPSPGELFFSLMDYKNNYFISNNPYKIIEFYNSLRGRDELFQWMKERPNGVCQIHEVEGNKEIIVVIPTPDFDGDLAKECREKIFNGLHIVFVESGEIPDDYFRGAHNYNVGIKKALEYDPRWIIIGVDDFFKIDNIEKLKRELAEIDDREVSAVFGIQSRNSKIGLAQISRPTFAFGPLLVLRFLITNKRGKYSRVILALKTLKLYAKYQVSLISSRRRLVSSIALKRGFEFSNFVDLLIISAKFASSVRSPLFDETFINSGEDSDLSIDLFYKQIKIKEIDYNIGNREITRTGAGLNRHLRSLAGMSYLSYKWETLIK